MVHYLTNLELQITNGGSTMNQQFIETGRVLQMTTYKWLYTIIKDPVTGLTFSISLFTFNEKRI